MDVHNKILLCRMDTLSQKQIVKEINICRTLINEVDKFKQLYSGLGLTTPLKLTVSLGTTQR
jgi:hypothetical protein